MKPTLAFVIAGLFALPLAAQETPSAPSNEVFFLSEDVDLKQFVWKKRPVIVFADSTADPRFIEQMELLDKGLLDLRDRDIVVLSDTDPAAKSDLRLKLRPRGFMLAIVGKDGNVKLRKPFPWDVREITRVVDKMPLRKQEIRDQKATAANDN